VAADSAAALSEQTGAPRAGTGGVQVMTTTPAPQSPPGPAPAAVSARRGYVLRALYVFYYGSNVTWMSFFNVYLRQLGFSGMILGLIAGVRPAAMMLSQPGWGVAADLWGRQRVLLLSLLLGGLGLFGYLTSANIAFVFVWTIVFASLSSPIGSLIDSLVLDHLAEKPGQSFGHLRLWGAVGWMTFSLLAGLVVAGRDLRLMFVMGGALLLAGFVLAATARRRHAPPAHMAQAWRGATVLLRERRLLTVLGLAALVQFGIASYYTFFSVYLAELGASLPLIGLSNAVQGLSELPVFLLSAAIIRKLGSRNTLALAMSVFALRMFMYSVLDVPALAVLLGLTHGLSFSLMLVSFISYINGLVPAEWRATGQSLFWAAFFGAGAIAGNAWAGFLYDRIGAHAMFRLDAVILAVAALATLLAVPAAVAEPAQV
jgi:MFS transporter, PPP family, 3-phenylpropionic acid transporter